MEVEREVAYAIQINDRDEEGDDFYEYIGPFDTADAAKSYAAYRLPKWEVVVLQEPSRYESRHSLMTSEATS